MTTTDYEHLWGYAYKRALTRPPVADDLSRHSRSAETVQISPRTKNLACLEEFTGLSRIIIQDSTQELLDDLVMLKSLQECELWRCRATSFESLEQLNCLRRLYMRGNTKCVSLLSLPRLNQLTHLAIIHFPKVKDYSPIGELTSLTSLAIEGDWGPPIKVDSLGFAACLLKLRCLHLTNTRVLDGCLEPLWGLKNLEYLACGNQFSVEQFAGTARELPNLVEGCIEPYWETTITCEKCGTSRCVMPAGKGSRFACRNCDAARLEEHIRKFNELRC
jgi:hypothetical protein